MFKREPKPIKAKPLNPTLIVRVGEEAKAEIIRVASEQGHKSLTPFVVSALEDAVAKHDQQRALAATQSHVHAMINASA